MNGVEIYGSGPEAAYLAALFASSQVPVSWYIAGEPVGLRPALLRGELLARLRRFLMRHGMPVDALLNLPELEGWGTPGGVRHRFRFDFMWSTEPDAWVDSRALLSTLSESAVKLGVSVRHVPVYPFLAATRDPMLMRCADIEATEAPHWPLHAGVAAPERWQVTEIHFARGAPEKDAASQFAVLEGTIGSLEPHPGGGQVLTLASRSRYALERAIASLSHPKASGPRAWRVLHLMNPGASRRDYSVESGPSNRETGELFAFGASVGRPSPAYAWTTNDALEQSERLFRHALGNSPSTERWNREERQRLQSLQRRLRIWEKLLASERFHGDVLAATALMPKPLRQLLKSPR